MIRTQSVRGRMLWFNEEKGHGYISSDEGERLYVEAGGFPDGHPVGPCAGLLVEFAIAGDGDVRQAQDVRLVEEIAPRRARRRGSR